MSQILRCSTNSYFRYLGHGLSFRTVTVRHFSSLSSVCLKSHWSETTFGRTSGNFQASIMPVRSKGKKVCHHGPTNTFMVATPIGEVTIISCPKGIHYLNQSDDFCESDFHPDKIHKVELTRQLYSDNGYTYTPALQCIQWLKNYFSREHNDKVPNFCPSIFSEGSFTSQVWLKLLEVAPYGTTISYKDLSAAAGNSSASRAAGQAMANNPISLVIPCHRVIRSDGTFGNYGHGNRNCVKQWLLKFEKGEV